MAAIGEVPDHRTVSAQDLREWLAAVAEEALPHLTPELEFAAERRPMFDLYDAIGGANRQPVQSAGCLMLFRMLFTQNLSVNTPAGITLGRLRDDPENAFEEIDEGRVMAALDFGRPLLVSFLTKCAVESAKTVKSVADERLRENDHWPAKIETPWTPLEAITLVRRVLFEAGGRHYNDLQEPKSKYVEQMTRPVMWYEFSEMLRRLRHYLRHAADTIKRMPDLGDGNLPLDQRWRARFQRLLTDIEMVMGPSAVDYRGVQGIPGVEDDPGVVGGMVYERGWHESKNIPSLIERCWDLRTAAELHAESGAAEHQPSDPEMVTVAWVVSVTRRGLTSEQLAAASQKKPGIHRVRPEGRPNGRWLYSLRDLRNHPDTKMFAGTLDDALQQGTKPKLRLRRTSAGAKTRKDE